MYKFTQCSVQFDTDGLYRPVGWDAFTKDAGHSVGRYGLTGRDMT
jgi:hypothetical protein